MGYNQISTGVEAGFHTCFNPGELVDDEQLKAKEYFVKTDHPVMGSVSYPGAPFRLSETPFRIGKAPLLGEDNEVVYGGLGFSKEEIVTLREQGII